MEEMQVSHILHIQRETYFFMPEGIQRIHGRFEINAKLAEGSSLSRVKSK